MAARAALRMRFDASRFAAVYRAPGRQRPAGNLVHPSGRRRAVGRLVGAVVLLAVLARAVTVSRVRHFARELVGLYWDSGVANDVPALAWFLLSSLVPLAFGVTALAAVGYATMPRPKRCRYRSPRCCPGGPRSARHSDPADQGAITAAVAASIIGMMWVSSGAVGVIERCLLRLLARPSAGFVRGKLRNLAIAAVVTVVIMLMVAVATAATDLVGCLKLNPTAIRLAAPLTSFALAPCCAAPSSARWPAIRADRGRGRRRLADSERGGQAPARQQRGVRGCVRSPRSGRNHKPNQGHHRGHRWLIPAVGSAPGRRLPCSGTPHRREGA
jgi:hypothetical protein